MIDQDEKLASHLRRLDGFARYAHTCLDREHYDAAREAVEDIERLLEEMVGRYVIGYAS